MDPHVLPAHIAPLPPRTDPPSSVNGEGALRALLALADGITSANTTEEIARATLRSAALYPQVTAAWLCLQTRATGRFDLAGQIGVPAGGLRDLRPGELCSCQRALLAGELPRAMTVRRCERLIDPRTGELSQRGHTSIPLRVGDRTFGVLNLAGSETGVIADADLPIVDALGRMVAVALQRVETEKVERDRARGMEILSRLVMHHAQDAVAVLDPQGVFLEVNPAAEELLGRAKQDLAGHSYLDIVPDSDRSVARMLLECALLEGALHGVRLRVARPSGELRCVEIGAVVTEFPEGVRVLALVRDVTTRNESAPALLESQEHLRALVQVSPLAVVTLDLDGRVRTWNASAEKIFGWSAEEAIGGLPPYIDAETEAEFRDLLHQVLTEGSLPNRLVQRRRRDGSAIDLSLTAARLHDPGGRPTGVMTVLSDVTDHQSLRRQFQQAQKMEAVGRLAGGVAHDFNNLLTVISGYSQLLLAKAAATGPERMMLGEVSKAAERAAGLTRQLLAFSRKQVLQPRVCDLNALVGDLARMLGRLIGEDVDLRQELSEDLGQVLADPGQIEQVIMNLVVNARDAMPEGGTITLSTRNVELTPGFVRTHMGSQAGPHVCLTIADAGTGMSPEVLSHLFEPFYTTKEQGRGTGLGLATVYGIVKQSGGYIDVQSELGHGSRFHVYLPRIGRPSEPGPESRGLPEIAGGPESILVIEDDHGVRTLVVEVLRGKGYSVYDAPSAAAGMELLSSLNRPVDLAICDVVMPGSGGCATAHSLLREKRARQVLLITGYPDRAVEVQAAVRDGLEVLMKPISPVILLQKVRELLHRSGRAGSA